MKKPIFLVALAMMSATVFGQARTSRLSAFSGVGYNPDYNIFSFNTGTEYSYYLNPRIYLLGTFNTNVKSLNATVTVSDNDANQQETVNVSLSNLRLQLGAGVDLLHPNSANRLYLQGQAGLGYMYGNTHLPVLGNVSYEGSMKTVGGSFGYDRKLNNRWALGGAYTLDYNWLYMTHAFICKVSCLF